MVVWRPPPAAWSTNWIQLLLARIGVGVGEAVGLPASQSVISDYFPPERRATALGVFLLAPPIGAFLGSAGGSWIGQEFGWRQAFFIATIPGLLLAIAAWVLIAEPPRGRRRRGRRRGPLARLGVPPAGRAQAARASCWWARRWPRWSASASTASWPSCWCASSGSRWPRRGCSPVCSVACRGDLGGRRAAGSPIGSAPQPGRLCPGSGLLPAGRRPALHRSRSRSDDVVLLLLLVFVAALFQYTYLGVTFGVFQNLLHPRMRATGSALLNTVYGLIGQGLGPLLVGWLSDRLATRVRRRQRARPMRMAITAAIYLWAGVHYLLAGRHLTRRPGGGARGEIGDPLDTSDVTAISEITEIGSRVVAVTAIPEADAFILHWGKWARSGASTARSRKSMRCSTCPTARSTPRRSATRSGSRRSNVSTALKELQSYEIVRRTHVHGDRRDHFVAETDPWDLLMKIAAERKRREIDPTVALLGELAEKLEGRTDVPGARARADRADAPVHRHADLVVRGHPPRAQADAGRADEARRQRSRATSPCAAAPAAPTDPPTEGSAPPPHARSVSVFTETTGGNDGYDCLSALPRSALALTGLGRAHAVDQWRGVPRRVLRPRRESSRRSTNHLLVVGFYLMNLGFILLTLQFGKEPATVPEMFRFLSSKVGLAVVVLGGMHFFNMHRSLEIRPQGRRAAARGELLGGSHRGSAGQPIRPGELWEGLAPLGERGWGKGGRGVPQSVLGKLPRALPPSAASRLFPLP